jgi:hypothetical protein
MATMNPAPQPKAKPDGRAQDDAADHLGRGQQDLGHAEARDQDLPQVEQPGAEQPRHQEPDQAVGAGAAAAGGLAQELQGAPRQEAEAGQV